MPRIGRDASEDKSSGSYIKLPGKGEARRRINNTMRVDFAERDLLREHGVLLIAQRHRVAGEHDPVGECWVLHDRGDELGGSADALLEHAAILEHEITKPGLDCD